MVLFKKIFAFKFIVIFCSYNFCSCQTIKSASGSNINLITGYFILYRAAIVQADADNMQPKEFYDGFYVKELSEFVLEDFIKLDSFKLNIYCIDEPWGLVSVNGDTKRDSIYKIVNSYTTLKEMHDYHIFDTKKISKNIINSNDRFMAVYKGQLATIGPFLTTNSTPKDRQESYGYFYLKDARNFLEYIYTIVLPSVVQK